MPWSHQGSRTPEPNIFFLLDLLKKLIDYSALQ